MKDFALHSTLKIRGKAYEIVGIVKYRMPDKDNAVLNKYILQHSQEMKELLFDNAEGIYVLQEWMPHITRTPPDSSWRELSNDVMVIDKSSTKDMFSQRDIEKPFRITIYQKKHQRIWFERHDHGMYYSEGETILPNYVQISQHNISINNKETLEKSHRRTIAVVITLSMFGILILSIIFFLLNFTTHN